MARQHRAHRPDPQASGHGEGRILPVRPGKATVPVPGWVSGSCKAALTSKLHPSVETETVRSFRKGHAALVSLPINKKALAREWNVPAPLPKGTRRLGGVGYGQATPEAAGWQGTGGAGQSHSPPPTTPRRANDAGLNLKLSCPPQSRRPLHTHHPVRSVSLPTTPRSLPEEGFGGYRKGAQAP